MLISPPVWEVAQSGIQTKNCGEAAPCVCSCERPGGEVQQRREKVFVNVPEEDDDQKMLL